MSTKPNSERMDKWQRLRAYGEERFRAKLRAEGLDPDRMTEDEKMDYVNRAVHEYRQEQRDKQAQNTPD